MSESVNGFNAQDYAGGHFSAQDAQQIKNTPMNSRIRGGWNFHTKEGDLWPISDIKEAKIALAVSEQTHAAAPATAAAVTPQATEARKEVAAPFVDPRINELATINQRLAALQPTIDALKAEKSPDPQADAKAQEVDTLHYTQEHMAARDRVFGKKKHGDSHIRLIQINLNRKREVAHKAPIQVDGYMGPETAKALDDQFKAGWKHMDLRELAGILGETE